VDIVRNEDFNLDEPLAFFITWTTYGTWLPGDDRGWQILKRGGIQAPDRDRELAAKKKMTESSFVMSEVHRSLVEQTVRKHCEIRRWHLHTLTARSNHVHVVVTASGYGPKTVREQFQAWCTRRLKEVVVGRENFWTERGNGRCINTTADLERVIQYCSEAQDLKHLEP
jgi:REP element-mobilizing transposase RayT